MRTSSYDFVLSLILTVTVWFMSMAQAADPAPPEIPQTARGVPVDYEKGYALQEISSGLYWVTDGSYIAMFIVGTEGVAVIDAPPSVTQGLQAAIAETTDLPVTHLVYSHAHGDHIGAAAQFGEEITIIAHKATALQLEFQTLCLSCVAPRPAPTVTFDEEYQLDLGDGQRLELSYHGSNHLPGNIFIYAPKQKTLMLVDVIYPGWVPYDLLAVSADIPGWIKAYDQALEYEFETFIGGHMGRSGSRADVELSRDYIHDVKNQAIAAFESTPQDEFYQEMGSKYGYDNAWWLVDTYAGLVNKKCEATIIQNWRGRLGGVETYAYPHCKRMFDSLLID